MYQVHGEKAFKASGSPIKINSLSVVKKTNKKTNNDNQKQVNIQVK